MNARASFRSRLIGWRNENLLVASRKDASPRVAEKVVEKKKFWKGFYQYGN